MNLHKEKDNFKDAIITVAKSHKVSEIIIEKDYWVTYILKSISESEYKGNIVFKGGTSLSKAYNIIKRFSEDIDLALIFPVGCNNDSQKKQFLRKVSKECTTNFPEVNIPGITSKHGIFRKTAHEYPKITEENKELIVKDKIILELNSFTKPFPNQNININSMIGEYLIRTGRNDILKLYSLEKFPINVLDVRKTLVEKIFSMIRHSYSSQAIEELKGKIRHIYDIYFLLKKTEISIFFNSDDFLEMINGVIEDDKRNSQFSGDWISSKWSDSVILSKTNETWDRLNSSYLNDFRPLVYGNFPSVHDIKDTLNRIHNRFKELGL